MKRAMHLLVPSLAGALRAACGVRSGSCLRSQCIAQTRVEISAEIHP